ncbi:MAG: hypothetical protein J5710_13430 [Treponema sp.]|nr:hypothetical protein [Treponema sp.]
MKKTLTILFAAFSLLLIFSGCGFNNLQIPKEVKVKTDATYEFPILNLDSEAISKKFDLSKFLDIEKMLNGEEGSESQFKVYKYNSGSKYQQFLLHMPLSTIEFDFSKSFGDMDFSNVLKEGFGVEKEFAVPNVTGLNDTRDLDLSSINRALNNGVTFWGMLSKQLSVNFTLAPGMNFDTVTYTSGEFVVDTNPDALINPMGGDVEGRVSLIDKDGNTLSTATFENNRAYLDISGKTITREGMKLKYEGDIYYYTTPFRAYISSSSKMATATGITLPSSFFNIPTVNVSFPLALGEDLGNVVIEEGSLSVEITTGDTWSENVISNYSIDISGGFDCHVDKANPQASLNGKTLQNADINAAADVDVSLVNATIDFTNPPKVAVVASIEKVSAEITMPQGFETSISQEMDVPGEVKNYIQSITWKKIGFNVVAETNLPEDNDIGINIQSSALGITNPAKKTIYGGLDKDSEDYKQQLAFIAEDDDDAEHEDDTILKTIFAGEGAISKIDISGAVDLPGSAEGKLAVSNVTPGETYTVSIKIEPVFEWKTADVKLPENANFNGELNTSINKKSMFAGLGEDVAESLSNIQIGNMPVYIFANLPQDFIGKEGEAAFGGTIKAYYGKETDQLDANGKKIVEPTKDEEGNVVEKYLIGSAEGNGDLSFEAMPSLEQKNAAGEITTDFRAYNGYNFADILNMTTTDNESTLFINYNVGLSGAKDGVITLNQASLEKMKEAGATSISIDVVMLLNLNFTLSAPIEINLMHLMNSSDEESGSSGSSGSSTKTDQERDLLNRAEPTDTSGYQQYMDSVKYASIIFENTRLPIDGTITFMYNMYNQVDANGEPVYKESPFGNGQTTPIDINPSAFLSTYPLEPSLKIKIGDANNSTFGLLRETKIGGKIKVRVVTDPDKPIKVYPFSEQN